MYSAAFIFGRGRSDDTFHALDARIHEVAESSDGFLGRESRQSAAGHRINAIYHRRDQKALQTFSNHPEHLEAKWQDAGWYKRFHVAMAEILRFYADGHIACTTPGDRA